MLKNNNYTIILSIYTMQYPSNQNPLLIMTDPARPPTKTPGPGDVRPPAMLGQADAFPPQLTSSIQPV